MNLTTDGLQPSMKPWCEEETSEAIYTIYLKKVRYHHSASESSDQLSHLEWETVRIKVIKAGTLDKLIESLASDTGELESTYMNIFFSTYRSFASPNQVLTILLNRYQLLQDVNQELASEIKEQHKRTLEKVIQLWLEMYPEDFYEPPQFLSLLQIVDFSDKYLPGSVLQFRAKRKLQKFLNEDSSDDLLHSIGSEKKICSPVISFLAIPEKHFASQLTYTDSELFKKLIPHQCLGSVWSRRDKACGWSVSPYTVTATVNQFNAVSLCVISTVLSDLSLKPCVSADIITKWINIAQELRNLKNFSSLKAITAALQSNSVHRLTKIWHYVCREKIDAFSELAKIFSEENNQINCRELLVKEGSAKFADTLLTNNKHCQRGLPKHSQGHANVMQGTIPYLGTFLTDLTMIDAAIPDYLPNGLINFEKRRREFEILAQIKLLQSAANSYDIAVDNDFQKWFSSIHVFDERESYKLSCLIESPDCHVVNKKQPCENIKSPLFRWGYQKCDSSSSTSSEGLFYDQNPDDTSMISIFQENGSGNKTPDSNSNSSLPPLSQTPSGLMTSPQDFYIIKVSYERNSNGMKGINVYKSIMLKNQDRTRTVIMNAMAKYGINGDPDNYSLVQLTPEGEIVFPDSANVYYAVNAAHELNFLLKPKYLNGPVVKKSNLKVFNQK